MVSIEIANLLTRNFKNHALAVLPAVSQKLDPLHKTRKSATLKETTSNKRKRIFGYAPDCEFMSTPSYSPVQNGQTVVYVINTNKFVKYVHGVRNVSRFVALF
jgi:hypothetical protein